MSTTVKVAIAILVTVVALSVIGIARMGRTHYVPTSRTSDSLLDCRAGKAC